MKVQLLIFAAVALAASAVDVQKHLSQFGFMNPFAFDSTSLEEAIRKYQKAFKLPETGVADEATVGLMSKPRCGRPDNDANNAYADTAWRKKVLTYYFNNFTPDLSTADVQSLTKAAFKFWADNAPLHFSEQQGGDIVIAFGSQSHHDGKRQCAFNFDGRSGVLAHAFFPPDGRLHFDEDEHYTARSSSGTNYLWVATHELGHILGLEHDTNNRDAVMYPYYRAYTPDMRLHSNDIARIQRLYGRGSGSVSGSGSTGGNGGNGGSSGNCQDEVTDCYKNLRGCSRWGQAWIDYMKTNCKKSCNFC